MKYMLRQGIVGAIGILLSLGTALAAPEGTAGPLVGQVTGETAELWMYAPKGSKVTVRYIPKVKNAEGQTLTFVPDTPLAADLTGAPGRVTLEGLASDTPYNFQVSVDGKEDPAWAGSFKTAPASGASGKFRVALTSCMKIKQPQTSWNLLLKQDPDLHLTIGDTHYADTTNPKVQWEHHLRYRGVPEFAKVLRSVPTYSMWDDHDYGPNNSDGTAKGKENSLQGWKQFWANPEAGTKDTPGAFYSFTWSEVEFFMVDSRYHRSPDKAPDDEKKRMLGDAQFAWLMEELKSSKAKFKVIASGSTLDHSKADGWKIYTFSKHRLFDRIKKDKIPGVLYFSGDIHASLVWEHPESDRVGYPLVEVISSGVANSKTLSFATIDFDTSLEDPTVQVRIVHGDGTIKDDRVWKFSQLGGAAFAE
jgi:alkaline phosphatase D